MAGKLTVTKVRATTRPGKYGDGDGLWLHVRGPRSRTWIFRYQRDGAERVMSLGKAVDLQGKEIVTLAEARELAAEAKRKLARGIDPLGARIAARAETKAEAAKAMTFRTVAGQYVSAHAAGWRNAKHAAQWTATLASYVYPRFGDKPVAEVVTGDVLAAIEPIWRTKPETAVRVRGRIESVLDYARTREWRTGENPARWKGHLQNLLPARGKVRAVEHHAALPWAEVGPFMAALADQSGTAALALRFAVLTAARSGEARGATWGEIDLGAKTWTVPAERMKAGREHRVPLSAPALALLRAIHPDGAAPDALVFPSTASGRPRPLSDMALTMVLRRMGRGDITAHGFRSTFRDWAAETTGFPGEVAEAALAHVVGDKVEAAYRRGDLFEKRRQLMDAWAEHCARVAPIAAEVVPLRRSG